MINKIRQAQSAPTPAIPLNESLQQHNVGVSVYDSEFLLVSCNKRFLEMFDLPKDMVQPGAPLVSILRLLAERGEYGAEDVDDFVRSVIKSLRTMHGPLTYERCRADGFYYESNTTRLESGCYITIHTDITQRKKHDGELNQAHEVMRARMLESVVELRQRKRQWERELLAERELLESVLDNMRHGIIVVDKDMRLRVGNRVLLDLLDYPGWLIVPGTPYEQIARYNAERGDYGPGDVEDLVRQRMEHAHNPTPHKIEQVRHNNRVVEVCGDPMPDGGFVTTYTDITERKQAEDLLLESKRDLDETLAELELILKNASLGVSTVIPEPGGRRTLRRVNLALERMLGYAHGELEGQDTRILYADEGGYATVSMAYRSVVKSGQTYTGEHVFQCKDGRTINVTMRGSAIDPSEPYKGAIWLVEDITERKRIEAELAAKTELLKSGTDNMPAALVVWDSELNYVLWTPNVEEYFNLPPGFLVGKNLEQMCRYFAERGDFGTGDIETQVREQMRPYLARETMHVERHMPDGRILEVRRHPLPNGGYVSVSQDITERKRLEAELLRAKERAEQDARAIRLKSKQVTSLLDNSGQGFLSFGGNLVVDPEYSHACLALLGQVPAGKDAAKVLFAEEERKANLLRKTISMALGEADLLKRDMMLSLMPGEFRCRNKFVKAEYKILENGHVMVVLTDVTEERRLEERVRNEQRRLEMIVAAVTETQDFFDTVGAFRIFAGVELPAMLEAQASPNVVVKELYRQVHTFKGLLNQFSFSQTPQALHELEGRLEALRQSDENLSLQDVGAVVLPVPYEALLDTDLAALREALGADFLENTDRIMLTSAQAGQLEELATLLLHDDRASFMNAGIRRLLQEISCLRKLPVKNFLKSFDRLIEQTAERLGKEVAPVEVQGDDIWVDPKTYRPFLRSLVHVFRNAAVHGIEDPDTRLKAGKQEAGAITCNVRRDGATLKLEIADDGAGIDLDPLRRRAAAAGLFDCGEAASVADGEIANLIFLDNMSTNNEASIFAGRGVGLSAVYNEARKLGGDVSVRTSAGKGTWFQFSLPL